MRFFIESESSILNRVLRLDSVDSKPHLITYPPGHRLGVRCRVSGFFEFGSGNAESINFGFWISDCGFNGKSLKAKGFSIADCGFQILD